MSWKRTHFNRNFALYFRKWKIYLHLFNWAIYTKKIRYPAKNQSVQSKEAPTYISCITLLTKTLQYNFNFNFLSSENTHSEYFRKCSLPLKNDSCYDVHLTFLRKTSSLFEIKLKTNEEKLFRYKLSEFEHWSKLWRLDSASTYTSICRSWLQTNLLLQSCVIIHMPLLLLMMKHTSIFFLCQYTLFFCVIFPHSERWSSKNPKNASFLQKKINEGAALSFT